MGRMSEKRKAELQLKYGNDALKPISIKYFEQARIKSARYILFVNKDNKHGYCEKCCHDVEFEKTKHKAKMVCPNCGTELTIQHTWRKPKCEWTTDWFVKGELIDNETFILRYIKVDQDADYTKTISELAREVYDFKHGWRYQFSFDPRDKEWQVNNRYYFIEHCGMGWYIRKDCCIVAEPINNIYAELKGISVLKYMDNLYEYYSKYTFARDNIACLMNALLYEKLDKVGLHKMAMIDYLNYNSPKIKYKRGETSLIKMLGLNQLQYNLLIKYKSGNALDFIRNNKELSIQILDFILFNNKIYEFNHIKEFVDNNEKEALKTLKYIMKNKIGTWEYGHYLSLLQKLDYTPDNSYRYPNDFRKADKRVSDEYREKLDKEELKRKSQKDSLIKGISDGLRNMPDLAEFLGGSNGLLVYIPESAKDLIDEGRALHNCIGSYVDRIAENRTLVFFVRRLNAPNDPFVAFEYVNGEVVQCRYDHNKNVEDAEIINFVDAFAERLRKNKVLYKVA